MREITQAQPSRSRTLWVLLGPDTISYESIRIFQTELLNRRLEDFIVSFETTANGETLVKVDLDASAGGAHSSETCAALDARLDSQLHCLSDALSSTIAIMNSDDSSSQLENPYLLCLPTTHDLDGEAVAARLADIPPPRGEGYLYLAADSNGVGSESISDHLLYEDRHWFRWLPTQDRLIIHPLPLGKSHPTRAWCWMEWHEKHRRSWPSIMAFHRPVDRFPSRARDGIAMDAMENGPRRTKDIAFSDQSGRLDPIDFERCLENVQDAYQGDRFVVHGEALDGFIGSYRVLFLSPAPESAGDETSEGRYLFHISAMEGPLTSSEEGSRPWLIGRRTMRALAIILLIQGDPLDSDTLHELIERSNAYRRETRSTWRHAMRFFAHQVREALSKREEKGGFQLLIGPALHMRGRFPWGGPALDPLRRDLEAGRNHRLIAVPVSEWTTLDRPLQEPESETSPSPAPPPFDPKAKLDLDEDQRLEARLLRAVALRRSSCQDERRQTALRAARNEFVDIRRSALKRANKHAAARAKREEGRCLIELDCLGDAERALRQACLELEALRDELESATASLHLAWLLSRRDRFEEALALYTMTAQRAELGQEPLLLANALQGQGQCLVDLGQEARARAVYRQAFEIFKQLDNRPGILRIHGDLATLEYDFGHPERALEQARAQGALARQEGNDFALGLAQLNIGRAYIALERHERAIPLLEQSSMLLTEAPVDIRALTMLAHAEALLGFNRPDEADARIHEALDLLNAPADANALDRIELEWQLARIQSQCLFLTRRPREAMDVMNRGISALERWRRRLSPHVRPFAHEIARRFTQAHVQNTLAYLPDTYAPISAMERAVAPPSTNVEGMAHRRPSSAHAPGQWDVRHIRDLQRTLPSSVHVITFFSLEHTIVAARLSKKKIDYLTIEAAPTRVDDEIRRLDEALEYFPPDASAFQALETLSKLLVHPIREWLPSPLEKGMLGIVTDGLLSRVPWQALPIHLSQAETDAPLGTMLGIFRAPSLRALEGRVRRESAEFQDGLSALFVADPFNDLPEARAEAATLADLFQQSTVLEGEMATWKEFTAALPRHSVIHIALHADRAHADDAVSLLLRRDPASGSPDDVLDNTDAIRRDADRIDSRRLSSLDWHDALVVLSSCHSGGGRTLRATVGPDQIPLGILQGGAAQVLASSWRIFDHGLERFFQTFYTELLGGRPGAQAMATAQRESWKIIADRDEWLLGPGAFLLYGAGMDPLKGLKRSTP